MDVLDWLTIIAIISIVGLLCVVAQRPSAHQRVPPEYDAIPDPPPVAQPDAPPVTNGVRHHWPCNEYGRPYHQHHRTSASTGNHD